MCCVGRLRDCLWGSTYCRFIADRKSLEQFAKVWLRTMPVFQVGSSFSPPILTLWSTAQGLGWWKHRFPFDRRTLSGRGRLTLAGGRRDCVFRMLLWLNRAAGVGLGRLGPSSPGSILGGHSFSTADFDDASSGVWAVPRWPPTAIGASMSSNSRYRPPVDSFDSGH